MIRKVKNKDLEQCKKIIAICFDQNIKISKKKKEFFINLYLSNNYLKEKKRNSDFYVFEKYQKVIAMGILENCCIKKVFIHPKYQGKGIGTKLMNYLEEIGIEKGCKELIGYCFPNSISFCKKNGFNVVRKVDFNAGGLKISATLVKKYL